MLNNLYFFMLGAPFIGIMMVIFSTSNENLTLNLNRIKNFICVVMVICGLNILYINGYNTNEFTILELLSFKFSFYKILIVIILSIHFILTNFSNQFILKNSVEKINAFVYMGLFTNFVFIIMANNSYVNILGISSLSLIFYLYYFSNHKFVSNIQKLFMYSFIYLIFILGFVFYHGDGGIVSRYLIVFGIIVNILIFRKLNNNNLISFELINTYMIVLLIFLYFYINIEFTKYNENDILLPIMIIFTMIVIFVNKNSIEDLYTLFIDYISISMLLVFLLILNIKSYVVIYDEYIGLYALWMFSLFALVYFIGKIIVFYNSKLLKQFENKLVIIRVSMILVMLNLIGIPFSVGFDIYIKFFEKSIEFGTVNATVFLIAYLLFVLYNIHIISKIKSV